MFETFEHTADLGLRVRARELNELFAEAGRGLFTIIAGDLEQVRPEQASNLSVQGQWLDELLFDWLTELLYRFDTQRLLLCEFRVQATEVGLEAVARGEPWDESRHPLEHEVKAITYHGLKVEQVDECWLAEVIVDI
jgi:SHS2 domain-containing protein